MTIKLKCSLDSYIASWVRREDGDDPFQLPAQTITISREYGCEAYPVAECLQKLLQEATGSEWKIYDKTLIEQTSMASGISKDFLTNLGDSSHQLDKFAIFVPNMQTHNDAYQYVKEFLVKVAKKGNAIIIGQGGAIISKEFKNCTHFRIEAPFSYRVSKIAENMQIDLDKAEKIVRENSRNREAFIEECLNAKVSDIQYYDAVFNNEKHTPERMAKMMYVMMLAKLEEQREKLQRYHAA